MGWTAAEKCLKEYLDGVGDTLAPNKKMVLELLVDGLIKSVKTCAVGQGDESKEMGAVVDYLDLMNTQYSIRILEALTERLVSEEKNRMVTQIVKHEVIDIE